jgi:hypothetical protein
MLQFIAACTYVLVRGLLPTITREREGRKSPGKGEGRGNGEGAVVYQFFAVK